MGIKHGIFSTEPIGRKDVLKLTPAFVSVTTLPETLVDFLIEDVNKGLWQGRHGHKSGGQFEDIFSSDWFCREYPVLDSHFTGFVDKVVITFDIVTNSELTPCRHNTNRYAALQAFAIFTFTLCST